MGRNKINSIVTESKGSRKARQQLFSQAGALAVASAKKAKLPITSVQGNEIIREYPNGERESLGHVQSVPVRVRKFIIK